MTQQDQTQAVLQRLDPDAREVVQQVIGAHMPPIPDLQPFAARMLPGINTAVLGALSQHPVARSTTPVPQPVGRVDHRVIDGRHGQILLRVYTPKGDGPFPVLVYFHGGGFVIFNLDTYDSTCRALCDEAGCVVVSVAYHQAPEHPFPAAPDDALTAYRWVLDHAGELNGDSNRVAVGGESAGGNLAAVTALRARDEGLAPPVFQMLIYPMTNAAFDTPSYQENADAIPLNKPMMEWFWGHYLQNPEDAQNPYASPLRAPDLSGLPPALVVTAEVDPLHSEGVAYAQRLQEAGVNVTHHHYDGVMHEFFSMAAAVGKAREANRDAARHLRRAFGEDVKVD